MRHFVIINGVLFLIFLFLSLLPLQETFALRLLFSLSSLSIVFFLPGWNATVLIASILKKRFSLLEFFTLSMLISFIIPSLLLVIEYQSFQFLSPSLPIVNSIILFLTTAIFLKQTRQTSLPIDIPQKPQLFLSIKFLSVLALLYLAIMGSLVTAYYPLPDLDPYYWISESRNFFAQGTLPTFRDSRPLFIAFTYLFSISAHIDLYAYFKYVVPLLSVLLIFPATLIAQSFRHPLQKSIALLFPFTSGIVIIFLGEAIPQAIASILTFFIIALALHASYSKDRFFFSFVGIAILLGYFFHEALIIPLLSWILATLFFFHTTIWRLLKKHSLTVLLILIIILPYFAHIGQHFLNISNTLINSLTHIHPNFLFPQEYINVDGNQMGWGDLLGVAKYYLFYVGPTILLLLLTLFRIKKSAWKEHLRTPENFFIFMSFLLFFLIAEILPRAVGMAFLPDRAWIFGGVFALGFFPILFRTKLGLNKLLLSLFLCGFCANIGAAVYINTLKKYLITNEQLISAEWIKNNLPEKRIIFTVESKRLLGFFSDSDVISIKDPNFLFDKSVFTQEITSVQNPFSEVDQEKTIKSLQSLMSNFSAQNISSDIHEARKLLEKIEYLEKKRHEQEELLLGEQAYYVYYAAPNSKNPYLDRPYMKKVQDREKEMIFGKYPEKFKLLYSDEKNQIFLWEIL